MRYQLKGLHCANCAAKIEAALQKELGLDDAVISFATGTVVLPEDMLEKAKSIVAAVEPGVAIVEPGQTVALSRGPGHAHGREHSHEHGHEHGHEHVHAHGEGLSIPVIATSAVLLLAGVVFNKQLAATPYSWAEYAVLIPSYLLVGWPVIRLAFTNLQRGQVFDENALMTVATFGAVAIRQLPEAAAVMVFYSVGEYLQHRSVDNSRRSISALLDIRPEYANVQKNGDTVRVNPEDVNPGDTIIVKPGERVPLDGEVLEGDSMVDTSALTGESVPRQIAPGNPILAGMVNGHGLLTVKVTKAFGQSSVARILELVQNAASRKAPTEQFITRFSRYYTPGVVYSALAVALVPPIFIPGQTLSTWVYRALVMLVISCPCALVISIPLGYFGGIGGAARKGVLVKGANYLDALADAHTVIFDKTGTLTEGVFQVTQIDTAEGFTEKQVLRYAAGAESFSSHPIAQSILGAYGGHVPPGEIEDYSDKAGYGVSATIQGKQVLVGKSGFLAESGITHRIVESSGTVVYVAVDGVYAGAVTISDKLRDDTKKAISDLRRLGIEKVAMLTGDQESVADRIAKELGLDQFYAELLPEGKVEKVEGMRRLMPNQKKNKLVFVGDGINDAPVIARADVGVAMGGLGSDAAIEAADVVLMEDAPSKLVTAVRISRWTRRIVRQNVALALLVKGFFLVLGAFGVATIWEAVFADVGLALLAVFNAMRTLRYSGD